jgi:hypothetical protein
MSEFRGHAYPADRVAGDGGRYAATIGLEPAMDQGEIDLFHLAAGELFGEVAVSGVGPRNQDHAAG